MIAFEFVWKNPHIPTSVFWSTAVIVLLTTGSALSQHRALVRGLTEFTAYHFAATVLAALFTIAYLFPMFTDVDIRDWTLWLRPVLLVVWPVAYIWPGLISARVGQNIKQRAKDVERRVGEDG